MTQLNKLQIKAEIMTILSKLQMDIDTPYIDDYLSVLYEQDDKNDILDILLKELNRANEAKSILICLILVKVFDQKFLEDVFWKALENPTVSDAAKTVIIGVLKDFGNSVDYEKVQHFFEDPQQMFDSETQRLLDNAILNPEAQIDFIDFLNALNLEDKETLVHSLAKDYSSDELANLLNPIVLCSPDSEIGKQCIDILGETKSQLALYTLQELASFCPNDEIQNLVKKNISKLKISGIREENAMEFYKNILPSTPYEAYASYPDGHGNQAVIFSREKKDGLLQMVAIVINDIFGVVDCFGFNTLSKLEFNSVVNKFYGNDERIYLDEHCIKKLLTDAEILSRKKGEDISYEYICWKNLFADVTCEIVPIKVTLESQLQNKTLNDMEFTKFCMMNFVQKWFFEPHDNEDFEQLINNLDKKVKEDDFSFDLESLTAEYTNKIFDNEKIKLLDTRLLMSAYLKYLSGSRNDASIIFAVYNDVERKQELMKNILRKSIYEHFVSLKFKQTEDTKTTNIFSLKNKQETPVFPVEKLNKMIQHIEKLWVI